MFDIGWAELLVMGALALIVVGPKDLPGMLRNLGRYVGQAKRMGRDFQRAMEDAADSADMGELSDLQKSMSDWNRKIGSASPRRYAESVFKDGDKTSDDAKAEDGPAPGSPAPGSYDAADAAENEAWSREQAAASPDGAAPAPGASATPPTANSAKPTSPPADAGSAKPAPPNAAPAAPGEDRAADDPAPASKSA